jgi:hypothetical protein
MVDAALQIEDNCRCLDSDCKIGLEFLQMQVVDILEERLVDFGDFGELERQFSAGTGAEAVDLASMRCQ